MATLLLTALGTAVGGPIGGALGALIGRRVDQHIVGGGSIEGPRLNELSVSTSSYGQAVPKLFGRMRVPGTVIWATDLIESTTSEGGGKGRPGTTSFAYSISMAVAIASNPIVEIGRIWADGHLLRGAAGDLKTGGQLRIYRGLGDDQIDPLIAAALGDQASAFRDFAYVVFEQLDLAEFGNRVPALSFEVIASDGAETVLEQWLPDQAVGFSSGKLDGIKGFADNGGALGQSLATLAQLYPIECTVTPAGVAVCSRSDFATPVPLVPEPLEQTDAGRLNRRDKRSSRTRPAAVRYYDLERDYQPGLQRAAGRRAPGLEQVIELPATLSASGARALINASQHATVWADERLEWRVGPLDPAHLPGANVRVPGYQGVWSVAAWEWSIDGVELELRRHRPALGKRVDQDLVHPNPPVDAIIQPTRLHVFETPSSGSEAPSQRVVYAAASSATSAWRGATLYEVGLDGLSPITATGRQRAVIGDLVEPLAPSRALMLERESEATIDLVGTDMTLPESTIEGLAQGRNRLLVGGEVLQYLHATPIAQGRWRLRGLLRGRAGTEDQAALGHAAGTAAIGLDHRILRLPIVDLGGSSQREFAAIGLADEQPQFAAISNPGLSLRPPAPVHAQIDQHADGAVTLAWCRRARGYWSRFDSYSLPLVEERELYRVSYGEFESPFAQWDVVRPSWTVSAEALTNLKFVHGSHLFAVRQIGTFAESPVLTLGRLI